MTKKFRSLKKKLITAVLIVSSLTTAFMTAVSFYLDYQQEMDLLSKTVQQVETSALKSFEEALWNLNMSQVASLGTGVAQISEIVSLEVFSENDEVVFSRVKQQDLPSRYLITKIYPLEYGESDTKEEIGKLKLIYSKHIMFSKLRVKALYFFISQGLKTLLVSFILFILFHILVTKHIIFLTKYLDQFRKTSKIKTIPPRTHHFPDETDKLADSIYQLALHVNKYNQETESQLKSKSEELVKLVQFKGDFLASMSHEIRTPLNATIGFLELLEQELNTEKQSYYLNKSLTSCELLINLINQVLYLSKMEQGKMELQEQQADLNELLKKSLSIFEKMADDKNIDLIFKTEIDPSTAKVLIDAKKTSQIIINILGNAIKFTENGSVTLISSLSDSQKMYIEITDTGAGIPEDQLESIFEAYQQVSSQLDINPNGTGLGLAITKKILALMKGHISVSSKLGQGTTFKIEIPLKQITTEVTANKKETSTAVQPPTQLSKLDILVVDDNSVNREVFTLLLADHQVSSAENGKIACEMFESKTYDIVILDTQMPVMNGYEAAKKMRQIETSLERSPAYIISVSANVFSEDVQRMLEAGCDDHLPKPVRKKDLYEKIYDWKQQS